jgi:hypothetical protein
VCRAGKRVCLAGGDRYHGFGTCANVFGDRLAPLAKLGDDALDRFVEVTHCRLAAGAPHRCTPAKERWTGGFPALGVGFDNDPIQIRGHDARRGGKVLIISHRHNDVSE